MGAFMESSIGLLQRARAGDEAALELLVARYLPRLQRWASGRLPGWARDITETQDLVQETLIQTLKRIEAFEPDHDGAFQAYLRQGILNRIRDEMRRAGRRPPAGALDSQVEGTDASPLESVIGAEAVARYERALGRLRPEDREAIIARIELDCSNSEIAELLRKPTANAARMTVERALVRLAEEMRKDAGSE